MCTGAAGSSYEGTIFNRVLQGQYIQAGRQGPRDKGETSPPTMLDRNEEVVRGNSFKLRHQRPGTVSLCLSENDDEEAVKLNPDYRNVEFMITTGKDAIECTEAMWCNQVLFNVVWSLYDHVAISANSAVLDSRPRSCSATG